MKPKHHKVQYFLNKGLFSNVNNFDELETRIANLPNEDERGAAFEVFAEAYLNTQSINQANEVWPEKQLPHSLRNQLGIPSDAGVDGIFKTHSGFYNSYQVKFRTGRPALTWNSDGLGNFLGQSDRVNKRILFTNSNDLSSVMDDRVDFCSIKGNDLDQLNQSDFKTDRKLVKNRFSITRKKITATSSIRSNQ